MTLCELKKKKKLKSFIVGHWKIQVLSSGTFVARNLSITGIFVTLNYHVHVTSIKIRRHTPDNRSNVIMEVFISVFSLESINRT